MFVYVFGHGLNCPAFKYFAQDCHCSEFWNDNKVYLILILSSFFAYYICNACFRHHQKHASAPPIYLLNSHFIRASHKQHQQQMESRSICFRSSHLKQSFFLFPIRVFRAPGRTQFGLRASSCDLARNKNQERDKRGVVRSCVSNKLHVPSHANTYLSLTSSFEVDYLSPSGWKQISPPHTVLRDLLSYLDSGISSTLYR